MAVVAPTDPVVAGKKWDGQVVPSVFNVGKGNATMPLNVAFSASNKPRAFILNTDKAIIDKRQPPIPNINNKGADHEWPR